MGALIRGFAPCTICALFQEEKLQAEALEVKRLEALPIYLAGALHSVQHHICRMCMGVDTDGGKHNRYASQECIVGVKAWQLMGHVGWVGNLVCIDDRSAQGCWP